MIKDDLSEFEVSGIDSDEEPEDLINIKSDFESSIKFVSTSKLIDTIE